MTGLRRRRIPNQHCWRRSIEFTALPLVSNRLEATRSATALSLIETELPPPIRDEDSTMTNRTPADRYRTLRLLGALLGLSAALGACAKSGGEVVTASVPDDYRLRHPIAIQEADRSVVIFVGHARGGLSASQRADVVGLAQTWARDGTGAIVADVPVDTPNARAAEATFREARSLLVAGGVPPRGITMRTYRPDDPRTFPPIRLSYPRITAVAGPCGLWPEDLGPNILDKGYTANKPYY